MRDIYSLYLLDYCGEIKLFNWEEPKDSGNIYNKILLSLHAALTNYDT